MTNHYIREGDNADLTELRKLCTFDTEEMAAFLNNDKIELNRKRQIQDFVAKHPVLGNPKPYYFMTRKEKMENSQRKAMHALELAPQIIDVHSKMDVYYYNDSIHNHDGHPFALHNSMFMPCLEAQADEEQLAEWLPIAKNNQVVGTYCQTEMGHGTNLRKLESTATFDEKTDEFVINSPTITSTKFWPGNLGKNANICIFAAQLYTKGKCFGTNNFIIQIRDFTTHEPLPGVEVGDIGPKLGYACTDNGFLRLSNIRIPRRHMLMRFSKVDKEGNFTKPLHDKISYTTMLHVRSVLISFFGNILGRALTIAIRYSGIRRQGEIDNPKKEVQVLDYTTQKYRLFIPLSRAFAYIVLGRQCTKMYQNLLLDLKNGNADAMTDMHEILCGVKAVCTYECCCLGVEQARLACGGHGYSDASGLPYIYTTHVPGLTYEGENTVMLLQCASGVMKSAALALAGERSKLSKITKYLAEPIQTKSTISTDCPTTQQYIDCLEVNAKVQILKTYKQYASLLKSGMNKKRAMNECGIDMTKCARRHTKQFVAKTFAETVADYQEGETKEVLSQILELYLANEVTESPSGMILSGFVNGAQLDIVKKRVKILLELIKPNAVSIVDSFDFTDNQLMSVLGRRDGHVYENLLKFAQSSELNETHVLPSQHYIQKVTSSKL
uniref:Acyl-coenzyme A oxidase n=1 Tax=Rhabditophanes sp. KR3021 TaxID=114890 RepID=A0AC35TNP9_9BILA